MRAKLKSKNRDKGETMYYNSNNSNSDYYNTYKQEMATLEDYHEGFSFQKIVKIGFTILMIGLISILTIYLVNYFSTDIKTITATKTEIIEATPNKVPTKVAFSQDILPKSIQLEKRKNSINPKDVALIVEIIMTQINNRKNIENYALEKELLSTESSEIEKKTLKESNHYNKVVVSNSTNNSIKNREIRLRENINRLLTETTYISSAYEKAITEEVSTRSNEMRIIVVQKGDTLSKIAKKAYGNFDAYTKILMANPEVVKNPNEIFVGQKLRIPA